VNFATIANDSVYKPVDDRQLWSAVRTRTGYPADVPRVCGLRSCH